MAMKKSSRRGAGKREGAERSTSGKPMQTKTPRYAKTRRTRAGTSPKGEAVTTKSGPSKTKARGAAPAKTAPAKTATTQAATAKTATAKTATAKPAPAKPALAKPAPAKPATAKPAPATALRGSAGKKILADLGLTNEELHAFLPADAPKWVRSVLWCQFDLARSLEEIEAHFRGRFETSMHEDVKFPPDGPDEGIPVRSVTVRPASRYVAYTFYGMRGEQYVESGSYQLEAAFGESGTTWGSNRAVYERFKALELPELGATNVRELTE